MEQNTPSPDDLRALAAADNPAADVARFILAVEGDLPDGERHGVPSMDAADRGDTPAD